MSGIAELQPVWQQELMLKLEAIDSNGQMSIRLFSARSGTAGSQQSSIGQLVDLASIIQCRKPTERWIGLCDADNQVHPTATKQGMQSN